jgi:hypothetical protein
MRSVTRVTALAALAALALAGCGNYSTEDLRFLAALPKRADLKMEVPAQGNPFALVGPCASGTADTWLWAKPTSDGLNAGVDFVLSLVDLVRGLEPSWRGDDARRWGPLDDERHPGREIQILMARTYPPELEGDPAYVYAFQGRVEGTEAFTTILSGAFRGGSASTGAGLVTLDFDAIRALGMEDEGTPEGAMHIAYDRASEPVTIGLTLGQAGFGVPGFAYGFAGYADRQGRFVYRFVQAGNVLTVDAGFDAAGAGRAQVGFVGALGGVGSFRQCWDANACLVYVDDPNGYSCGGAACSFGTVADCPPVTSPPF